MQNRWLFLGALSGLFCVAFGAIASHALRDLPAQAHIWIDMGIKYQMFHTLALLALGFFQIADKNPPSCRALAFNIIGGSWLFGILGFSGSLYMLALDWGRIPMLTPIGGMAFLVGWAALAYIALRTRKTDGQA